jgi:hypothetical protein
MTTHLFAAGVPLALSAKNLVTYLQGPFGPLFLGVVAIFFLFTREITRFVQFTALALAIAIASYTPGIVQVLTTGIANALGVRRSRPGRRSAPLIDLPTYANIWRIEKGLYKLYDFRPPTPLPVAWGR